MQVSELEAIQHVRELPGGFLDVEECESFTQDEAQDLAKQLFPKIQSILNGDEATFNELYTEQGFWRDQVALTWTFRTFHQKENIVKRIPSLIERAGITNINFIPQQVQAIDLPNGSSLLRIAVSFSTSNPSAKCTAAFKFVRMKGGHLKLFTTTTMLNEVDARPWGDCVYKRAVKAELPDKTDVLILGAGHAGLAVASYLSALNIDFAILDREKEVGDAWAKRYDSATLHTTRVFSGLPYKPFPRDYPEFVGAKDIAKYYRTYVKDLNLPIYQDYTVQKADWDDSKKEWIVKTNKGTVIARSLIFAIGIGGRFPIVPNYPGQDSFKGEILHSIEYTNPERWKGKKVAVVGASTTGLDVGWDCSQIGIDVTVVQRGPTRIYAPDHIKNIQKMFWNDETGAEYGDAMTTEDPVALQEKLSGLVMKMQKDAHDPAYYEGLEKAGFLALNDGPVHNQIFCHGGKHYPDIGAGQAIIDGEIKIKSGTLISQITPSDIEFEDGSKLDADVIVWCTGFKKDNRDVMYDIIGDKHKLEPIWGLDKEGEIRGVYRPSGSDYCWVTGGELQTMRYYGRFLAMQVAAELDGIRPEPVRV